MSCNDYFSASKRAEMMAPVKCNLDKVRLFRKYLDYKSEPAFSLTNVKRGSLCIQSIINRSLIIKSSLQRSRLDKRVFGIVTSRSFPVASLQLCDILNEREKKKKEMS